MLRTEYHAAEKCFEDILSNFSNLSPKEILEKLNICLTKINYILNSEISDNNVYVVLLLNLKQEICNHISQFTQVAFNIQSKNKYVEKLIQFKINSNDSVQNFEVKPKSQGLCDVAGLNNIKNILRTLIISPINQPQLYVGVKFSNCILFFGPPGTGKTKLADAIAAEANATLISATASNVLSHYFGQSEKMLRSLFDFIKMNDRQTILFIDEIDGLCKRRVDNESDAARRLKTEFMCQMSDFESSEKGFLICATNCPWELDVAFIRRFQKRIYIPLPNIHERCELLKLYTKNTPLQHTSEFWDPILQRTEGFSSCDMMHLVQHALTAPIMELHQNQFWKFVNNEYYEPFCPQDGFADQVHVVDFDQLPPRSVRARKANISDLMESLNEVKRTVSDEEIKKYESYISRN